MVNPVTSKRFIIFLFADSICYATLPMWRYIMRQELEQLYDFTPASGHKSVKRDIYNRIIKEIIEHVVDTSDNLNKFSDNLLVIIHYFNNLNDFPETILKNGNSLYKFLTIQVTQLLETEKDAGTIIDKEEISFIINNYSLKISFDIFNILWESPFLSEKRNYTSVLVHLFWQHVMYEAIFFELISANLENLSWKNIFPFFFHYRNVILPFNKFHNENDNSKYLQLPNNTLILTSMATQLLLFIEPEKNQNKSLYTENYGDYIYSPILGPVIGSLDQGIKNLLKKCNNLKENKDVFLMRALIYLLYRMKSEYILLDDEGVDINLITSLQEYIKLVDKISKNGGDSCRSLQKRLRQYLLNTILMNKDEYNNKHIDQYIYTLNSMSFFTQLSKQLINKPLDYFKEHMEEVNTFFSFLNSTGGLNLFQFPSFKWVAYRQIDYPAGYICGEQPKRGTGKLQ